MIIAVARRVFSEKLRSLRGFQATSPTLPSFNPQSPPHRVTEMLSAANLLHFTVVVDKCCEYLRTRVTPGNVIKMREFVYTQGLTKFQLLLDRYKAKIFEYSFFRNRPAQVNNQSKLII